VTGENLAGGARLDRMAATAYSDIAVRSRYPGTVDRGAVTGVSLGVTHPAAPPEAPRATPPAARLDFVDGIRALAALFVVLHHVYITVYDGFPTNTGPAVLTPLLYGHFGVAVFIVVSGFSLGLAPAKRGWKLGRGGYWTFMRRRAWRIIPPYWAALAVSVAMVAVLGIRTHDAVSWKGVATHFLLVQDLVEGASPNGAFWSIAVEWQLYWVFPLLLLVRRLWGPVVLTALSVSAVVAIGIAGNRGGGVVAEKLLAVSPQLGALFVFGLLAAAATTRPPSPGAGRIWGGLALAAGLSAVLACAWLGTERAITDLYWLDLVVGLATACCLAFAAGAATSRTRRALEHKPLLSVGRYSYSLYLVHAPVLLVAWVFVVEPLDLPSGASLATMMGVVVPAIIAASYGFHVAVERPFIEHRSWAELRTQWARRRPAHLAGTRRA
jgi:peptidoglycan/LPS O-acetylase OafA/YrhL